MAVNTYSMKKDWNKKVSAHFSVYEFACSDHSDTVLIDTELVYILEQVRAHFGKPVHINSGYRSPSYNISIGGSPRSQHCLGTAADVTIKGVDPIRIALYLVVFALGLYYLCTKWKLGSDKDDRL